MAHRTLKQSTYNTLVDRLNQFPQGAPPSDTLHKILSILVTEREAELIALLPIRPFKAEGAAKRWKTTLVEARKVLEELAGRALLVDVEKNGESVFCLPPPMAGFFEFSMMRLRGDVDQTVLGQLYYQYMNVEEEFIRDRLAERNGIEVLTPDEGERDTIHRVIFEELCAGEIRDESRSAHVRIIERLAARGAQGVVLGCTEIPLLVGPDDSPIPIFDTTSIHARAAVDRALEGEGR